MLFSFNFRKNTNVQTMKLASYLLLSTNKVVWLFVVDVTQGRDPLYNCDRGYAQLHKRICVRVYR